MTRQASETERPNVVCTLLRLCLFSLVGAAAGWGLALFFVGVQQREETAAWLQQADDFVPREIENLRKSNQSLALLIQQADGRFGERELALYAPKLLADLAPDTALTLAPGGVLQAFHPRPSTPDWRGANLLEHPQYRRSSALALRHRDSVLQGPVRLLKGGVGLIVRTPVFIGSQQQFWGFVHALGPWSSWLSNLEKQALNHEPPIRFGLEIRDSEGSTYRSAHHQRIQLTGLAGRAVQVPGGSITLAAMPAGLSSTQSVLMVLAPLSGASLGAGLALGLCQRERRRQLARMALELKSAQAMERYQALFEESLDAVLMINREPRFIDANPRVAAMYGVESKEAFLRRDLLEYAPECQPDGRSSAEVATEHINEAFTTGSVEFEYQLKRLNTGELWLGQASLRRIELNNEPVLIARVRDITERRRYEQRIEDLAYRDGLTGLPNRAATQEWLDQQLQQSQEKYWLLINLDIDDFRSLNEVFDQDLGDRVLCWVADALAQALPLTAWLARLDSDEFLVVLPIGGPGDAAAAQAHRWAATLQQRASQAAGQQGSSVPRISLSAGCAIASGGITSGALAAMQRANTALRQAKENGRGGVELHSAAITALIQERMALEQELERALAPEHSDRAFRLLYQPQVNRSGRVVRAEALLRFRGANGDDIPPDAFIPLAERSGQIHRLGQWVMQTAVHQQALWRDQGFTLLPLSVNISARQLDDLPGIPSLLDQLKEHLDRYQLEPKLFVLELTETALLKDDQHIRRQLHQLVKAGFRISLDDFGTGYSSLAVLRDYPVSQVKIDKGFTSHVGLDPRSCSIVEALVSITRARRMDLVAEGVETAEQREALIQLGLRLFQGYLFAPGLEADTFAQLLQDPDQLAGRDGQLIAA